MEYEYYIILFSAFILSLFFVFVSIVRYRTIGLVDLYVVFAWFWAFVRPLSIDYCSSVIDRDIYFWNENYYVYGAYYTALSLVVFQIGAFIAPSLLKKKDLIGMENGTVSVWYQTVLARVSLVFFLLVAFSLCVYGRALFPWNRDGAPSVSLPGYGFFYQAVSVAAIFGIVFSLFFLMQKFQARYFFIFCCYVLFFIVIGRRGRIVMPILLFSFVYLSYLVLLKKRVRVSFLLKTSFVVSIVFFVIFFGKTIFYTTFSGSDSRLVNNNSGVCSYIKKGYQEYDLLWPAIVDVCRDENDVTDLPYAVVGNLIEHRNRILHFEKYYSITDKLMTKYNYSTYLDKKFGISPNMIQFYYSYFGLYSIFMLFIVGFFSRYLERLSLVRFFNGSAFLFILYYLLILLFQSPFDAYLKYYIVQFLFVFVLYLICRIPVVRMRLRFL